MIINLRGPSGSGKSYAVRGLIEHLGGGELITETVQLPDWKAPKPTQIGYLLPHDIWVLGKYSISSGGADNFHTPGAHDWIEEEVEKRARLGLHVIFEGLVVSGILGRYLALSSRLQPIPWVWAFMDTPAEECLRRIQVRNGGKPINEGHIHSKMRAGINQRMRLQEAGERVAMVPKEDPVGWLLRTLDL